MLSEAFSDLLWSIRDALESPSPDPVLNLALARRLENHVGSLRTVVERYTEALAARKPGVGDIYRTGSGSTAIVRLYSRHSGVPGGWHAEHWGGGFVYVHERYLLAASPEDKVVWESDKALRSMA